MNDARTPKWHWHHVPSWPDDPRTYATDRAVMIGMRKAGRVRQQNGGPHHEMWEWSGNWRGPDQIGITATLDEALATVRRHFLRILSDEPKRLYMQSPGGRRVPEWPKGGEAEASEILAALGEAHRRNSTGTKSG